ncbi:hypothetical protein ACFL08_06000, partial [Patescibacteria group bacterium]
MKKMIIAIFFTLLATSTVIASEYEGTVLTMKSQEINGVTRNSIFLGDSYTICATSDWFAYDDADTGIGKIWTAKLLVAYGEGKTVKIEGSGVCDQYGVESINAI